MKKTIKITCLFSFFILLISCNADKKKIENITVNDNLYVIDIDNTEKEDKIYMSSLFNKVKTIILETTDESLLGEINGIQISNDLIFVLDGNQNIGVHIFNKDGKFIRKIGKIGNGPGEFISLTDFTIDSENGNIFLLDSNSGKIYKYKISTGEFINSIKLEDVNISSLHLQYNNGKLYTDANYINKTDYMCIIHQVEPLTGKREQCWFDVSGYNKGWNGSLQRMNESFFYSRNQDEFKYIHFFSDTIISIGDGKITPGVVIKDKN